MFVVETINTIANTAAKALFGEPRTAQPTTEEPVSGRQGDTSKGEPYDAGNMEPISENVGREAVADESMTERGSSIASEDEKPEPTPTRKEAAPRPVEGAGPTPPAKETVAAVGDDNVSPITITSVGKKDKGEGKSDENKGTGEIYIKSTGTRADGGDFDATKPGAGREADRIMEEKGLRDSGDSNGGNGKDENGSSPSRKRGLGQKIKEKLHRH